MGITFYHDLVMDSMHSNSHVFAFTTRIILSDFSNIKEFKISLFDIKTI